MKTFMPAFKDASQLQAHQLEGLKWTVSHAFQGSDFYRERLESIGVAPGDIHTLEDLKRLPFTTGEDLKNGYPFPLLSVPEEKVVRIHASSGTTGRKKVLSYTRKDIEDWSNLFARCYEMAGLTEKDRVQIAVGYGVWTAGAGFQIGCEQFGAMALPVGPGNIDMQCQFLEDMQSTVFCSTASMALLMAEEINRRGIKDKIKLKKLIFGSERSSDSMRARIKELLGLEDMFDITGMTELYGPGTGLDCPFHEGIHYWSDHFILEILDPTTLEEVPDGQIGEMVVTTLQKEAAPLIRYRTRDLTRKIEKSCSCGSIFPMHDRILGRSDDMIIFRGVNFYPAQIDQELSKVPELGSEYQLIIDRKNDGKEYMTLKVERCNGDRSLPEDELIQKVAARIKNRIQASCTVDLCGYGELPRSERKSKRIFDNRMENPI